MKASSRVFNCIIACILILGLMPAAAFAETDSFSDEAARTNQTVTEQASNKEIDQDVDAEPVVEEQQQSGLEEPSWLEGASSNTDTGEDEIQPLDGVQEGPQVLEEGDFGENNALHWTYKNDASLTISGAGAMPDYTEEGGQPWAGRLHQIETVVVEEGISRLGAYSFYTAETLYGVVFPDSLLSIGSHAFEKCTHLGNNTTGGTVEVLEIAIPDSVEEIGTHVFALSGLKKVCLPAGIKEIPESMFERCFGLKDLVLPQGLEKIGDNAFLMTEEALSSAGIPDSVSSIGYRAFYESKWKSDLYLSGNLRSIGAEAFSRIEFNLNSTDAALVIGEGWTPSRLQGMFTGFERFFKVVIPASYDSDIALPDAKNQYIVASDNENLASIDGVLFSKKSESGKVYSSKTAVMLRQPSWMRGDYAVPEGVEEVANGAIASELSSFTLSSTVRVFNYAFNAVDGLTEINVVAANATFSSEEGILFSKDRKKLILSPPKKDFSGTYTIPDEVESIQAGAFRRCRYLTGLRLTHSIDRLEENCFGCYSLAAIYIPTTVTVFCKDCVAEPSGVSRYGFTAFYEGTEQQWEALDLSQCTGLQKANKVFNCTDGGRTKDGLLFSVDCDGTLTLSADTLAKEMITSGTDYAKGTQEWNDKADAIKVVVVEEYITAIGAQTFNGLSNLERVMLPYEMSAVGSGAFANCEKLEDVECLGHPFEVEEATSAQPSFGAGVCIRYKANYATQWEADAGYNVATSTWNGYKVIKDEAIAFPVLDHLELSKSTLHAKGINQRSNDEDIELTYAAYDEDGNEITNYVNVEVLMPERTSGAVSDACPLYYKDYFTVNVESSKKRIQFPRCGLEGDYVIAVTPLEGKAEGPVLSETVFVERDPEIIKGVSGIGGNTYGKVCPERYRVSVFDAWNQYYETVLDKVDLDITDKATNENITDDTERFGFTIDRQARRSTVDEMALQGIFKIAASSVSPELSGTVETTASILRYSYLLNCPYTISLWGGDSEGIIESRGQWGATPYRALVTDAYDDPIWPDLTWRVLMTDGGDVTEHFRIDEQGYMFVDEYICDTLLAGQSAQFTVQAYTAGVEGSGEMVSDPFTGFEYFLPKVTAAEIASNTVQFTLRAPALPEPVTHTATFKVGEDVIGQVVFEEGDTSLEEPALPIRENYIGEWEEYDLAGQTSDFVVQGVYSPMDPDKVSEVAGGVDAEYDNGLVNISISAAAATKNIKVESNNTKPLDAVMVLDRSGSMNDDGKLDKLKQCAEQFAQSLYENAEKTGADHRIALAGFAYGNVSSGSYNRSGYENSGLLTTASGSARTFQEICSQGCSDALLPINNGGAINGNIINAINTMTANGATAADVGLDIARRVFADSPDRIDANGNVRERVVIFITDGVPTSFYATDYRQVTETAAQAITMANVIKQGQGARIYSIGVDANASAEAVFNSAADGAITRGSGSNRTVQSYDFNRFLHAVSSNYPNAAAMSNLGDGDKAAGYYMAANDTSSLDKIFTNILYSTVYSIQSFDRATLTYKLPAGLVLTVKDEEAMRASLAQQGMLDEDIEVVRDGDSTTLVFRNVKVKREAVNGVNQYVARVGFQVSVDGGVSGEVLAGAGASAEIGGQATDIEVPIVNIPADRRLIVFKINGEIYEIRDAQVGDAITLPETDIARWLDLEKQESPVVKEGDAYVVFETSTLERAYTMKWIVNGTVVTETHAFGEELSIPSGIGSAVPEGMEISHWSPSLPQTMPARNVTCTAVLTPVHVHAYQADSYTTGSCTEGLTVHQVCACGEEQTSQNAPKDHAYKAYLSSAGQYSTTVEKLVCEDCGHSVSKNITYQVSKSSRWPNLVVLELDKYENEVLQSGPSDDDITIRFYVGDEMNGTYNVYRIDENGIQDTFKGTVENGYLSFAPNHFSDYVIGPISETGEDDAPTYEQVKDIKANPDLPVVNPDDEEDVGNDDGNNGDGDNENNGDNNGGDNNGNPDDNANTNNGNENDPNNGQDTPDNNDTLKGNDPDNRGDGTVAQPEEVDPADSLPTEYGAPLRPTQLESVLADTGDNQAQWIWCLACAALLAVALIGFLGVKRLRRMKR